MRFEVFRPCDALRRYVSCFILSETDTLLPYTVLPDTAVVAGFQYKGRLALTSGLGAQQLATAGVTGLQHTYRQFEAVAPTGTLLVKFLPGGAAPFFRPAVHELFNQSLSLDLLMPHSAICQVEERLTEATTDAARIRVIETFLLSCKKELHTDALVLEAVRLIEQSAGMIRMTALAKQLHISASPLEKRFRSRIGSSPKKYAGVVRFQRIIAASGGAQTGASRAYEGGYFDQAHFIRDFYRYSGQTPEAFFAPKGI